MAAVFARLMRIHTSKGVQQIFPHYIAIISGFLKQQYSIQSYLTGEQSSQTMIIINIVSVFISRLTVTICWGIISYKLHKSRGKFSLRKAGIFFFSKKTTCWCGVRGWYESGVPMNRSTNK